MAFSSSDSGSLPRLLSLLGTLLPISFAYLTLFSAFKSQLKHHFLKKSFLWPWQWQSSHYILSWHKISFLDHHQGVYYVIPQEGNSCWKELNEGNGSRDARHRGSDYGKPLTSLGLEGRWGRRRLSELRSWRDLGTLVRSHVGELEWQPRIAREDRAREKKQLVAFPLLPPFNPASQHLLSSEWTRKSEGQGNAAHQGKSRK